MQLCVAAENGVMQRFTWSFVHGTSLLLTGCRQTRCAMLPNP
jgi:hypothetical protein